MLSHDEVLTPRTAFPRSFAATAGSNAACMAVASYLFLAWFPALSPVALVTLAVCLASVFLLGHFSTGTGDGRLNAFLIVFLAASGVSAMLGGSPQRSLAGSMPMIPAMAVFMLVAYRFEGRRQVLQALSALIFAAFVASLGLLVNAADAGLSSDPRMLVQSLGFSQFVVPNDVAVLAILSPFPIAVALSSSANRALRIACLAIVVTFACAVVAVQSRLGTLLFLLSGVVTVVATRERGKNHAARGMALLACALVIPAIAVDAWLGWPLLHKTAHVLDTRFSLWEVAFQMLVERPILGHGPNTFGLAWDVHLSQAGAPSAAPGMERTPWCHSLLLEIAAERGLVGLGALLGVLGRIGYLIFRRLDLRDPVLAVPLALSFVLFSLAALFELTLLRQWVVTLLFLYAGMVSVISRTDRK
ncbi:hypothetical protein BWI17_13105 [Betaproteobacteria bacterium GR16-43]|nr:hypothetical protein BWI17_13105 [Betaproteobacteria bacterium GR16-43]